MCIFFWRFHDDDSIALKSLKTKCSWSAVWRGGRKTFCKVENHLQRWAKTLSQVKIINSKYSTQHPSLLASALDYDCSKILIAIIFNILDVTGCTNCETSPYVTDNM